jgi:hypothetical protein
MQNNLNDAWSTMDAIKNRRAILFFMEWFREAVGLQRLPW